MKIKFKCVESVRFCRRLWFNGSNAVLVRFDLRLRWLRLAARAGGDCCRRVVWRLGAVAASAGWLLAVGQGGFGGRHSPDMPLDASVASGVYGNDRAKNRTHFRHRCVTFTQNAQLSSFMGVAQGIGLL